MAAFNASDDESFSILVDKGVIASINPLIELKPSALDFSQSCVATLDLQNRIELLEQNGDTDDTNTYQIGRDLRFAIPPEYASATALESFNYWTALKQLDTSTRAVDNAVTSCREAKDLEIGLDDLNFTNSCPATSEFWWRFVYSKPRENRVIPNKTDIVALIRPALIPTWHGFTSSTIFEVAQGLLDRPGTNETITAAANDCRAESCFALSYEGNADIAGLGAVISYGCICFITTVVVGLCLYYFRITRGDIVPSKPARQAAMRSSLVFGDTVIFFTIMTSLASVIYSHTSHTVYEWTLSSIVAYMAFCAACLLAELDLYPQGSDHCFRIIARVVAVSIAFAVVTPMLSKLSEMETYSLRWIDMPCYGTDIWPKTYLYICAIGTIIAWAPYASWSGFMTLRLLYLRMRQSQNSQLSPPMVAKWTAVAHTIGTTCSFFVMWSCFISIVMVRNRARNMFGQSFADDKFGYGQIVASGFVLQVIAQYLYLRFAHKLPKRDSSLTLQLISPLPPDHLHETWSRMNGTNAKDDGSIDMQDDLSHDDSKHGTLDDDILYKQKVDHKM